jgi:hypothetical protein
MATLDCALLADGPSDRALLPILQWAVEQHVPDVIVHCEWADLSRARSRPATLSAKILVTTRLYTCDLLFIHRDAENQPPDRRYDEICSAIEQAKHDGFAIPHICVVPVRMQESWLLMDEYAIRRASGNPNGSSSLMLPHASRIESLPDPKETLYSLLRTASESYGRRLKKFRPEVCAPLVSEYMTDFSRLRILPSFQRLESDIATFRHPS